MWIWQQRNPIFGGLNAHISKLSLKKSCIEMVSPDMLSLLLLRSHPIQENTLSAGEQNVGFLGQKIYTLKRKNHDYFC